MSTVSVILSFFVACVVAFIPNTAFGQMPLERGCISLKACTVALRRHDTTAAQRAEVLVRRALILSRLWQHDRAVLDLAEAEALQPGDPLIARHQGELLRAARRFKDAERAYDRALRIEPHAVAFLGRCQVLMDAGRAADAIADCTMAHGVDPSAKSEQLLLRLYRDVGDSASIAAMQQGGLRSRISRD